MTNHIVIVGASLAGPGAAETLRAEGFRGGITVVGDEPHPPYDRPPLSKAVLMGRFPASHTTLVRRWTLGAGDVAWRLGVAAVGLDLDAREVGSPTARRCPSTGCSSRREPGPGPGTTRTRRSSTAS
jgi:NADPH-dependent 2,4-dienoyl-CoA reductase/sulfur reductase-like enzyme